MAVPSGDVHCYSPDRCKEHKRKLGLSISPILEGHVVGILNCKILSIAVSKHDKLMSGSVFSCICLGLTVLQ